MITVPVGANNVVYLPSLLGLMECIYRPCGANGRRENMGFVVVFFLSTKSKIVILSQFGGL